MRVSQLDEPEKATDMTITTPRPPEGDWLGTPYLRFTREGPFGVCTLDRRRHATR